MKKITTRTSHEDVKMHAKHVCEYAQTCNRVWSKAIELLRTKYDGKQLNKRFTDELNNCFASEQYRFYDGRTCNNINISIYERYGEKVLSIYLHKRSYTHNSIACYYDEEVYGKEVTIYPKYFDEKNHIKASDLISAIEHQIQNNNELIYKWNDAVKNYAKYRRQYEKAKSDFLNVCYRLNPMFLEDDVRTYQYKTEWRIKMEQELSK